MAGLLWANNMSFGKIIFSAFFVFLLGFGSLVCASPEIADFTDNSGVTHFVMRDVPADNVNLKNKSKSSVREAVIDEIKRRSRKHNLEPAFVMAVGFAESSFNPLAVSPDGAMGIMQLMPVTCKRFGVEDPFDMGQNIEGGILYLKYLMKRFDNNLELVLAAYNAGETVVSRLNAVPPYSETQTFVKRTLRLYAKYGGVIKIDGKKDEIKMSQGEDGVWYVTN